MTAEVVLLRLQAAQELLAEHQGQPSHAEVSRAQCDFVLHLLSCQALAIADLGNIGDHVGRCAWARQEERDAIMAALSKAVPRASRSTQMQDFQHLNSYFTEDQWCTLSDPDTCGMAKLSLVCEHAHRLGLRNPSEPTSACLSALLLICAEGEAKARTLATSHKRNFFKYLD